MPDPIDLIDDLPQLLAAFDQGPEELARAVRGLSRDQLLARPGPGAWSSLECLAHLADAEPVFADRIKRTLAMPTPLLLAFDEELYLQRLNYSGRNPETELAVVRSTREQLSPLLHALTAEDWDRPAVHDKTGRVTVKQLVQKTTWHLAHHTAFIVEKRQRLGM